MEGLGPTETWGPAYHLYVRSKRGEIWMLTLSAKNVSDDIPAHILKKIKEEIDA